MNNKKSSLSEFIEDLDPKLTAELRRIWNAGYNTALKDMVIRAKYQQFSAPRGDDSELVVEIADLEGIEITLEK